MSRRMLAQWQPVEDSTAFTSSFRTWRRALKMATPEEKPTHQRNLPCVVSYTILTLLAGRNQ